MQKLTESDKMQIIASRAAGVPVNEIARRHHVSRQTIHSVVSQLKKGRVEAKEEFDAIVYRNRLRQKSFVAVEAGLDDTTDNYKRGTLGMGFLKGTGDLQPDGMAIQVNNLIASTPPEMRSRYFINTDDIINEDRRNENDGFIISNESWKNSSE